MGIKPLLLIFVGGGAGCVLRYLIGYYLPATSFINEYLGTLLANVIGCLLLGVAYATYLKNDGSNLYLLTGIGFCGGLTTFSTYSLIMVKMAQSQQILWLLAYGMISVILGMIAVYVGMLIIGLEASR